MRLPNREPSDGRPCRRYAARFPCCVRCVPGARPGGFAANEYSAEFGAQLAIIVTGPVRPQAAAQLAIVVIGFVSSPTTAQLAGFVIGLVTPQIGVSRTVIAVEWDCQPGLRSRSGRPWCT
jgi:hypothetical protein